MKLPWHRWIRKAHRYLGVLIGVQFLAWTAGGLYFSWTDLDTVHGSDWLGPAPVLDADFQPASIDIILARLQAEGMAAADRIELLPISGTSAVYRISFHDTAGGRASRLADAATGALRGPLDLAESQALAQARYAGPSPAQVVDVRTLAAVDPGDAYRELPLPAHAFTFDDPRATTLYVAPEHARVTAVRNDRWHAFDFLWMLHTMDYEGRDNFNNRLLQVFAVFGLLTIISGFALFLVSSRFLRHASR